MSEEASPYGSQRKCRFYFATRTLTLEEEERFQEGRGLPSGVGYDPPTVGAEYRPPEEDWQTEGTIVKDGVGEYHFILSVTSPAAGTAVWRWRGTASSEGKPVAATPVQTFRATGKQ